MSNPFDIAFGKPPVEIIDRPNLYDEIVTSFLNNNRPNSTYIITGARGCGKTVAMTTISEYFEKLSDWIVIDLNPQQDMQSQLGAFLYERGQLKHLFLKKEFNFSFKGLGISISGNMPITSVSFFIEKMLEHLKRKGIKVLITIDEATNTEHMRVFSHEYQSFLRKKFDVALVMTGLYENVSSLQNVDGLTFLYRAPKLYLQPLNTRAMTYSYMNIIGMNEVDAKEAAELSNGYAFAYQLIGYLLYDLNKKKIDNELIEKLDILLDERSYSKIYSELTGKEKEIVAAIASSKTTNIELKKMLQVTDGTLSTYKSILSKKGIIDTSTRGEVKFALPRFGEFIRFNVL